MSGTVQGQNKFPNMTNGGGTASQQQGNISVNQSDLFAWLAQL